MNVSIGRQVKEALDMWESGDPGQALIHSILALAATSKRTHRKKKEDKIAFLKFAKINIGIITSFGLNVAQLGGLIFGSPDNKLSLEDILYDIRCHLIHELTLPEKVQFTENLIGGNGDPFLLPKNIILGLIAAVVVAPVNSLEYLPPHYIFTVKGKTVKINDYWGKKDDFLCWFESARRGDTNEMD
jgi:hypothetical protein